MALRNYQTSIALATLYDVRAIGAADQLDPSIWIKGGAVNIYVSNGDTPVSAPSGMSIISGGAGVAGLAAFAIVPAFIYVEQASGTTTEIVVSGLTVKAA